MTLYCDECGAPLRHWRGVCRGCGWSGLNGGGGDSAPPPRVVSTPPFEYVDLVRYEDLDIVEDECEDDN